MTDHEAVPAVTNTESSTPAVDPIAFKLRDVIWDLLEQMPCKTEDLPQLHRVMTVMLNGHGHTTTTKPEADPISKRTYRRNEYRPYINHVLQFHEHPTGRFTIDELLAGLKQTDCKLARDDNQNRQTIRTMLIKASLYYNHDKVEKTFSLRKPLLQSPLVMAPKS